MFELVRNILAFISTFAVISIGTMLLLQGVIHCVTYNWTSKRNTDYGIIIIGVIVAFLLIPFYYFPA